MFGQQAAKYDRARPSYPDELYDHLIAISGSSAPTICEVGCGTGIATRALSGRGGLVTAIDPDADMLATARRRQAADASVEYVHTRFEDWTAPSPPAFDLVVAAQSWHWVDSEIGYVRASQALCSGGALALMWNCPARGGFEHRAALDRVYRAVAPHLARSTQVFSAALDDTIHDLTLAPQFAHITASEYTWSQTLAAAGYIELLGTQSDHLLLTENTREQLFDGIRNVLVDHGGTIETRYVTMLVTATRL